MTAAQRVVLFLLVVSVAAGAVTGNILYYRLALVWVLLYFGGWLWAELSLRSLLLKRSTRTLRAQVGQVFEEQFEVHNTGSIPSVWVVVKDESDLPGASGSRLLSLIPGKQARYYISRVRLVRRGVFQLGPTVFSSGDLFGLFPRKRSFPASESLLVYPAMVEIDNFPNPPGLLPGGEALRRQTHQVTPNAAGVREYVSGDPLNRIHWLSTARRNRMMVKEFELDPLADVWIFLDAQEAVQAERPYELGELAMVGLWERRVRFSLPPSTEEYGVSIAASLARDYLRRGRAVGLVSAGQHLTLLSPDRGARQLGKSLEALALLRTRGEMTLRSLVETQVKHMVRGSTVVLITASVNPEVALIGDFLLQRGLKPVAVLIDAASFGGRVGTPGLEANLRVLGIPVRVVTNGCNLESVLSNNGFH